MSEEIKNNANPDTIEADAIFEMIAAFGGDGAAYAKVKELGVENVDDIAALTVDDLVECGLKKVQARKLVKSLDASHTATADASTKADINISIDPSSILPTPMNDEAWLASLRVGGVLKVDEAAYIAAIRTAFADKYGLFDVPAKLRDKMERFAEDNDEPVNAEYFKIQKMLTRRDYGEIFAAIPGLDGSFVSQKRKDAFITKTREVLWPAVSASFGVLDSWYESVRACYSDPSIMMAMFAGISNGMPPLGAAAQLPPSDAVRDASDTLKDSINHLFGGFGVPIASALCYDAQQISKILENSNLPAMVGATNREMMLKQLGVNVSPLYVRQEQNMVRFVLGFVKLEEMTTPGDDLRYLTALWQTGNQLGFKNSSKSGVGSIGGECFFA